MLLEHKDCPVMTADGGAADKIYILVCSCCLIFMFLLITFSRLIVKKNCRHGPFFISLMFCIGVITGSAKYSVFCTIGPQFVMALSGGHYPHGCKFEGS